MTTIDANKFPTVETGDKIDTAAKWNDLNSFRLVHAETYDYNDAGSDTYKEYTYTADEASTGVLVFGTAYGQTYKLDGSDYCTITVQVDGVVKQTILNYTRTSYTGSRVRADINSPIMCCLNNSDMTLNLEHTIKVNITGGVAGTMKITSLLIYAY